MRAVHEELPLISLMEVSAPSTCPFYDLLGVPEFGGTLDGGGVPIVVLGNPSDPATPISESQELVAETLANGYLVEVDHPAHVVYPAVSCANEIVTAVLVDVMLPAERHTLCR